MLDSDLGFWSSTWAAWNSSLHPNKYKAESSHLRVSLTFVTFLPKRMTRFSQNIKRKMPSCFQQEEQKSNNLKYIWETCSIIMEKLCHQTFLQFCQSLTYVGEGKYTTLGFPVMFHIRGKNIWESPVKFTFQEHRLSLINHRIIEHFYCPSLTTSLWKAYLPQFLYPICIFQQKIIRQLKRQK